MSGPKFDLTEVQKLVNEWKAGKDTGWFSAPKSSVEYVVFLLDCTDQEAEKIILDAILKLDLTDFSRRIFQWGVVADLYGLEKYFGYDWYIKFLIEDGNLEEISCHPLEDELKLEDGRNLTTTLHKTKRPPWRIKKD